MHQRDLFNNSQQGKRYTQVQILEKFLAYTKEIVILTVSCIHYLLNPAGKCGVRFVEDLFLNLK